MKEMDDEVFNLEYKNADIKRLLRIYRRTRRSRVKDKLFKRIFGLCLNEKGVIVLSDVAILRYDIYKKLVELEKAHAVVTGKSGDTFTIEVDV